METCFNSKTQKISRPFLHNLLPLVSQRQRRKGKGPAGSSGRLLSHVPISYNTWAGLEFKMKMHRVVNCWIYSPICENLSWKTIEKRRKKMKSLENKARMNFCWNLKLSISTHKHNHDDASLQRFTSLYSLCTYVPTLLSRAQGRNVWWNV